MLHSIEDRAPLDTIEKEFIQDQFNSWVGPFLFRTPLSRLPKDRQQALFHLPGLYVVLRVGVPK